MDFVCISALINNCCFFSDFAAGVAVNSIGHSDPQWVDAVTSQAKQYALLFLFVFVFCVFALFCVFLFCVFVVFFCFRCFVAVF